LSSPVLTLVAVHGNGGGAHRFARVEPFVPGDVRFCPVTLPGFAAVPRDPSLTSLRSYADRLRGFVESEPRPRVVLGHGIGGSIALELAQFAAPAMDGLILHAPVGAGLGSRVFPRLMALPGARALGQWAFCARLLRPLWRRRLFSRPVPRDYLDRFFDEYRSCSVFGEMFDLITPEWFESLRPVTVPAALLWGERERVLTVDQVGAFRALLPGCLVSLPGRWDHFPMIEDPEAYATEIVALARKLTG
jgi:pimeloyl-ACP methyl ester carboxylesterase